MDVRVFSSGRPARFFLLFVDNESVFRESQVGSMYLMIVVHSVLPRRLFHFIFSPILAKRLVTISGRLP